MSHKVKWLIVKQGILDLTSVNFSCCYLLSVHVVSLLYDIYIREIRIVDKISNTSSIYHVAHCRHEFVFRGKSYSFATFRFFDIPKDY